MTLDRASEADQYGFALAVVAAAKKLPISIVVVTDAQDR
jgi:hypothetical protein